MYGRTVSPENIEYFDFTLPQHQYQLEAKTLFDAGGESGIMKCVAQNRLISYYGLKNEYAGAGLTKEQCIQLAYAKSLEVTKTKSQKRQAG